MMRAVRAVVCALAIGSNAHAQGVPRVTAGWGVDTAAAAWSESAWHDAAREIYRAWSEYLRADPHLQQPTPHWSAAEQTRWPLYDLTSSIAYQGFGATILDIRPTDDERDGFIIRTLFASAADGVVRPVALTRVHAVRQDGRWVFANTLPRLTRSWQRATIGPVTYIIQPGVHFDPGLAVRALAAADSLADALGLARIDSLDYYVANNPSSCTASWASTGRSADRATAMPCRGTGWS